MIEDVRRFIIIADNRSLTKAAKLLHITQPALSLSLQRLEKEFNVKLISRTGKQFSITPDGENVYRIGLRILELWDKAKNASTRNATSQTIVIGLYDNAALRLAPFFQKQLREKKQIEIKIDTSQKLLHDLQDGILDICVCVFNKEHNLPKNITPVREFLEELIPVSFKKVKVKRILDIPFILYNKGSVTRSAIDKIFLKNRIQPTILAESTSTSFMKELALSGSGIALLPENFVINEISAKKLFKITLPFSFYRNIAICIKKEGSLKKDDLIIRNILENIV